MYAYFVSSFIFASHILVCLQNPEILVPVISFYICNPARASRDSICWFKYSSVRIPTLADSKFHAYVLLKMSRASSNAFNSLSVFAYSLWSSLYINWLSFCPLFYLYPNVVWFNTALRGFDATQKKIHLLVFLSSC